MADQTYEFIDQLCRLFENMHHCDEGSVIEDENEPGQLTDEGDSIILPFRTTHDKQQSKTCLDSRLYQQVLKCEGYRLLDVYNSNAIYLCKQNEMKREVTAHMTRTNAYSFIAKLNESNPTYVRECLDTSVEQVNKILNDLLTSDRINNSQFRQMNVERSKVRMDYLFFLPDLRQQNVPFQPMMICSSGPTIGIARYINRLLQPIYDQVSLSTTFFKETDAVHAIKMYADQGLLLPTTLFATFHINDLCTIVSHEEIMQALEHFLNEYDKNDHYIHDITIDTIIKLVHLVLQNQIFVFKDTIYQEIKGGATGSPLTTLLMNIYVFYWQENLVKIMINKNEIFGRCFDKVFLTWNGSETELRSLLHATINKKQPSSVQITTSIGNKINYIDAQISHVSGSLQTKINHDADTEPRCLPNVSDHPRHMYSTLIRACLIRAVLCCSNMIDFYDEWHDIEETFSTNGYTRDYINHHVEEFFREFNALKLKSHVDQSNYDMLRRRLFEYDQQQMNMRIKQRKDEQDKEKWYISSTLNGDTLVDLQEKFKDIWKDFVHNQIELRNIILEIIGQAKYPSNTK